MREASLLSTSSMNSFLNLPVRAKLFSVFAVILLLFAVAIGVAYRSIADLLATQSEARNKQINVVELGQILANHNEGRVEVLMLLGSTDRTEQLQAIDRVKREHGNNAAILERLRARNAGATLFADKLREHMTLR